MSAKGAGLVFVSVISFFQGDSGCGSDATINTLPASLVGTVTVQGTTDSLSTGEAILYLGHIPAGHVLVQDGLFAIDPLNAGCCYRLVILNPKTGDTLLSGAPEITLEKGQNRLSFFASRPDSSHEVVPIDRDTTSNDDSIIPPKR
jgi:hypothetical protein